ncbi:MAG: lysophospholipase [Methylococcaceae bacterium]|jgi:alpha-beta hydrolase superfamily lysophospholipase
MKTLYSIISVLLVSSLTACMPMTYPPGAKNNVARLSENIFLTEDGANLPFRHWLPKTDPHAVLIALHGFNDYSRFFQQPGEYFSKLGIACFAYDQRGFGAAPKRGLWAGGAAYAHDLNTLVRLVKQRYPDRPVYLLGESMGGAIIITAMSQATMPAVDGIILIAPALWARPTMPWYQTSLLWTLAHSLPWLTLTGEGVEVMPSDNIEMLRALGRDPWVIKATRVETIYGLTDLMDEAFNSATLLHGNTLMLYGEKDEIIPKKPTYAFLQKFLATDATEKTVAFYPQGYHMLLRDLQAPTAWKDIAAWINNKPEKLPSGADNRARQLLAGLIPQTSKEED